MAGARVGCSAVIISGPRLDSGVVVAVQVEMEFTVKLFRQVSGSDGSVRVWCACGSVDDPPLTPYSRVHVCVADD